MKLGLGSKYVVMLGKPTFQPHLNRGSSKNTMEIFRKVCNNIDIPRGGGAARLPSRNTPSRGYRFSRSSSDMTSANSSMSILASTEVQGFRFGFLSSWSSAISRWVSANAAKDTPFIASSRAVPNELDSFWHKARHLLERTRNFSPGYGTMNLEHGKNYE